jgi:hypothetical protein
MKIFDQVLRLCSIALAGLFIYYYTASHRYTYSGGQNQIRVDNLTGKTEMLTYKNYNQFRWEESR